MRGLIRLIALIFKGKERFQREADWELCNGGGRLGVILNHHEIQASAMRMIEEGWGRTSRNLNSLSFLSGQSPRAGRGRLERTPLTEEAGR